MKRLWAATAAHVLALAISATPADAAAWVGTDMNGADLTLANGDTLSGTFTNVGKLELPQGATVFVVPNVTFAVYASTIAIYGTLDGSGRGYSGGTADTDGFAASAGGAGHKGTTNGGGGGGAGAANGGAGARATGGAGGTSYGGTISAPLSVDDAWQGSGGGGGATGASTGGTGAPGGAAMYLDASSVTISGALVVNGSTGTPIPSNANPLPGGAGGGGGGSIVLRATAGLAVRSGARLTADGGKGGNVDTVSGVALEPGGGGGGGRLRLFARQATYEAVTLSTAAGAAGSKTSGFGGTVDTTNPPQAGAEGATAFGAIAALPAGFAVQSAAATSITYSWPGASSFGDGANPQFRVFGSGSKPPLSGPAATAGTTSPATASGLSPNTTYFVTAYTDWGDSDFNAAISTHTLAATPGAAATPFSSMADTSLTVSWTHNAPANPSYTTYEVDRALDASFGVSVATSFAVGVSSSPANLLPNTSYYVRVRAINLDNVPSAYATTLTTATLATAPSAPAFGTVFVTSASFVWSRGANPSDTLYQAQVSSDNFFSIAGTSATLANSATFTIMTPGTQYYFRVYALNRHAIPSAYSAVISTRSGNLSDTSQPTTPAAPQSDRRFSYDGEAVFSWSAAQSGVGILDYHLIVGSTPGGSDVFSGNVPDSPSPQKALSGLATGRTYYARVRARSNAGVYGEFSDISSGVPVLVTAQASPFAKPYNWPNPFDPSQGATQIGIALDAAAEVRLRVFTLSGRPVRQRTVSFAAGGNQVLEWDGRNDNGAKVAPGGYVVLIEKRYGDRTDTQKLKIAVVY